MDERKVERLSVYFGTAMLFGIILFNAWVTNRYYFNFIVSDDGAELILSRMLAHDGGVLSKNWHYSTELEILNTQLVYSFLFRFISDFKTVRIAGQMILTSMFLASYYFCLYSMDHAAAKKRFCKTAFLLLLPISNAWTFLILKTYYIPHVGISFLALGLAFQIQKEESDKKKKIILALGSVLAFVSCLEGMRHIQLTYLPLVLGSAWMLWNALDEVTWDLKKLQVPKGVWANICWLLWAGAGCLVNLLVLSRNYEFRSYDDKKIPEVFSFENIQGVWNALLEVTGYRGEQELFSVGGICNALAVVVACVILYQLIKAAVHLKRFEPMEQFLIAFTGFSFAIGPFIFMLLGSVEARWVLACLAPAILFLIFLEKLPFLKQYLILGGIYCIVLFFGACGYQEIRANRNNEAMRNVYNFVQDHDYTYGYCTMWVGDWLTEMTNGRFATRSVRGDYANGKLKIWHWLTPVQVEYREEPILCILEKERVEDLPIPEEWPVIMEDDFYIIYELTDHRRVEEYLESREGTY